MEENNIHNQSSSNIPYIVINNTNNNTNTNTNTNTNSVIGPKPKNKWIAFFLCLLIGYLGAHKFYGGKILLGIVYLLTGGILGFGWVIDIFRHLFKPNSYYV